MVSDINVKGTNHKIGGTQADGQWTLKNVAVFSGQNLTNGTHTYTVSNYLPDNDYWYEVLVCSYSTTGTSSGNQATWWVLNESKNYNQVMGYSNTRTNSNTTSCGNGLLPVKQNNNVLTLSINYTTSTTSSGCGLYLTAYRRLGGTPIPAVYYTLTINPTPADATVTFNKGTVVGNTCTVTAGTSVTYTVSKSGYTTQSGTVTVNADQTVNVTLPQITSIQLYGYDWAGTNTYLAGTNNTSGYVVGGVSPAITAKSGNIGASGSTLTLGGDWAGTYTFYSTIIISGVTLYEYLLSSKGYVVAVMANASVGKKGLIGSTAFHFVHPSSVTSTQMTWANGLGTSTATRKSSIDTTFTGS